MIGNPAFMHQNAKATERTMTLNVQGMAARSNRPAPDVAPSRVQILRHTAVRYTEPNSQRCCGSVISVCWRNTHRRRCHRNTA